MYGCHAGAALNQRDSQLVLLHFLFAFLGFHTAAGFILIQKALV